MESLVFVNKSIVGPTSVVAGSALLPQTTLQATGTTTLIGNVFVQGGALYPPGPMTSASTNLTGYAYGSGTYNVLGTEIVSSNPAWTSFDGAISTYLETAAVYTAGAYSNTTPFAFSNTIADGLTTYNGVWFQLQMPSAIVLEYYSVVGSPGGGAARSPGTWRVFGSNDGSIWTTIDSQASISTWASPQVFKTFYMSPFPPAYSWFRLSVQNLATNGTILNVGQWNLYGKPPVPAMSILGGDVTIASGGGLNVGPGTLGSNVVVFSNVSGGSNVFVMDSSGRIGVGTSVPTSTLTVTGNMYVSNALTTTNVFTTNVFATGQVTAAGRTGVGVCTPMIFRQGAAGANWNTPAANTSTVATTSGAVQMQCGANTMVTTTQFIPFPVSYTGNPIVLVTSYGTHGNIWVSTITSTNFSVSANTAQQFEWLSIGI